MSYYAHLFYVLCITLCVVVSPALQCENGLVYEACGPACSPACPGTPSVSDPLCSALSCVEGCFCPQGTVRHGKMSEFMCVCFVCLSDAFSSLQSLLVQF